MASGEWPQMGVLTDRPEQTLVVYSDNGLSNSRCVLVARALRRSPRVQPHRVLRLAGGLNGWKAKGFAVEGDTRSMLLGEAISERELRRVLENLVRLESGRAQS
uniref:Rhodanese domain-containing protein n=1 Tax=Alexandrium catenella TaxID=2925 RepID=A0A7S1RQK1_ALECA